ncbi:MAG: AAA family ATPase, partial [Caldilineaceae bacterium]|nr:AAA family ATPase [Caldilineaceae bacterium]
TLFGSPTIMIQGDPLTINRFQIRAFLFRLAAQAEPVTRDQLTQLFWPDVDDARARRHLTQLLSHVRRVLPLPKLLLQTPSHVQLNQAQIWSDVVAFKQLLAESEHASGLAQPQTAELALELYGGPFLDGISTPDLPEYELWLETERAWLERRYLELLAAHTLALMDEAAFAPALELSRRHLAIDELAEDAHRRLIACYAAVGERSTALRQYEHCVDLLQRELDVAPMAETVALHQAVLRGAPWAELSSFVLPAALQPVGQQSTTVNATAALLPAPNDHLPHEPLPIIGRRTELAALAELLTDPQNRLITIVGVGGMGKSRLALAAAHEQRDLGNFPDGIYFVALVALTEPNQIVPAILRALQLSVAIGSGQSRTPLAQLLDFLREKRLLLLLDNFEHLLDGADVVVQIERAAPGVHLLVTSRKVLGVHGEQLFPLNELPYPQTDPPDAMATNGDDTTAAVAYPAVQLFLQSAQRSTPRFHLTTENQAAVVRICQLVGGMPLALELAASWVTMLSAAEIGVEIAGSLDFLEAEIHDLPTRHQSVRALLDVVWQQLNAAERAIFTRFAIFQGGFTRQAVHEVAGASLHTLRSLTTNLLIHYDETHGRYSSHELLRTYGVEQLTAQPSVYREMQERHGRYYCTLLQQLAPELKGERQQVAFAELAAEQANLQAAWTWAVVEMRLALLEQAIAGMGHLYAWMGNQSDGTRIFETLVQRLDVQVGNPANQSADAPAEQRNADAAQGRTYRLLAEGLAWLAHFTLMAGQVDQAEVQLQHSFALLDQAAALGVDCRGQRAQALLHWGHLERPHDLPAAVQAYTQSRELYAQLDLAWDHAYATSWLGEAQHLIGQQEAAIALLTEARSAFAILGDQRNVARVLATIADSYLLDRADLHAAEETAAASLQLWRASGDQLGIANTAVILAYAHCWLNRPDL